MKLIKLTQDNAHNYIGYDIVFKTRNIIEKKKILKVSNTGKTIIIKHPDLNNQLEIVSRNVFVLI
jgi:hypothetical protein